MPVAVAIPTGEMVSRYTKPPGKRGPFSARLLLQTIRKIEIIRERWRAQAKGEGTSLPEEIEAIDNSFVASRLLDDAVDIELNEFGGMPGTAEDEKKVLAAIEKKASEEK